MNITEQILQAPEHPATDVRASSQGEYYPLSVIVRRAYNPNTCAWDGIITYEGTHLGTGVCTGIIRGARDAAIADIALVYT